MDILDVMGSDLETIRTKRPLVHSITNFVVMNETANATLCLGALPIMSHAVEEVAEMVGIASALVLNIGTLQPDWIDAMALAGKRANELGIPVILDPVGVGATRLRTDSARRLLDEVKVSITRGNKGEIAALAGVDSVVRGVESISASASAEEVAERFAKAWGCCAAVTGVVDVVHDGSRMARIGNGHEMLAKLVGTGCISDVVVAAFAAVNSDPFAAACGGLVTLGIAGEMAAEVSGDRPGTFHVELYNALYEIGSSHIRTRAKLESV
jgi:hydroxyethylthiazole kinase